MSEQTQKLLDKLQTLEKEFQDRLQRLTSPGEVEELRLSYLGRKGALAGIMDKLPELSSEDRPQVGKRANETKTRLKDALAQKQKELEKASASQDFSQFDHTLPGRKPRQGSMHPVSQVLDEICRIFEKIGFDVVTGPEIETDFYNFEALNIPQNHPARDMQDTLYVTPSLVLRTHTSPLQIRTMLEQTPPVAAIAPGKVYRRDADLTHSPMFHQIEGFFADTQVSMAELKGTLTYFVQNIFSSDTRVRFRPSFFPFTEPSAEVDISCVICNGSGRVNGESCRVCSQTGWVEILGCGMIDPQVFASVNYDAETYSGFAFGLGVERVAMLKYGIDDLRLFFDNDLRFLHQFNQLPVT